MSDPTPTSGSAPATPAAASPDPASQEHDEHHPRGTMVITLLFLLGTAIVWLWTFAMLIERSAS
jgi:hypothetical protein